MGAAKPRTWLYVKRCVLDLLRTLFIPLVLFSAENIVCISVGPQSVLRNDPSTSCEDTGYEFTCALSTLEYPFVWLKGYSSTYAGAGAGSNPVQQFYANNVRTH